jgi:hypothetical protein
MRSPMSLARRLHRHELSKSPGKRLKKPSVFLRSFYAWSKKSFKSKKIEQPSRPMAYPLLVEILLYSPPILELW